jgi:hypothetical protein
MSIEKTFSEFMLIHEKKEVTKDIKFIETSIQNLFNRIMPLVENSDTSNISDLQDKLINELRYVKKILIKNQLLKV